MWRRLCQGALFAIFGAYLYGFVGLVVWSSQQAPRHQQHQAQNSGAKHQPPQHHSSEWWGHSDPGVTAATVLLFIVGIAQAIMFYVQLRYMKTGMDDATAAAKAARDSAASTRDSVELARDEFNSTHRPKIRTKHVVLSSNIFESKPVSANITLINDGIGDAFIQEFGIKFFLEKKGNPLPPLSKFVPVKVFENQSLKLASGVSTTFKEATDSTIVGGDKAVQIARDDLRLYCVGYVHYRDGVNRVRTTAFCRVLAFPPNAATWVDTGRFRALTDPDPDYEYES